MPTIIELNALKTKAIESKNEESLALLMTIEQLQKESFDAKQVVLRKLNTLEEDMERLAKENERLIAMRESSDLERDACISLMVKLANKLGFVVGVVNKNVVLELKSGQVSWDFEESEAHLFEELPVYTKAIEEIDLVEKYRRVMNAGIDL